jgi:hypothetical protein
MMYAVFDVAVAKTVVVSTFHLRIPIQRRRILLRLDRAANANLLESPPGKQVLAEVGMPVLREDQRPARSRNVGRIVTYIL